MTKVEPLNASNDTANTTFEPLLDPESSLMFFLSEPAISTISFFKGDVDLEQSRKWYECETGKTGLEYLLGVPLLNLCYIFLRRFAALLMTVSQQIHIAVTSVHIPG